MADEKKKEEEGEVQTSPQSTATEAPVTPAQPGETREKALTEEEKEAAEEKAEEDKDKIHTSPGPSK